MATAPDAVTAIRAWAEMQAWRNPRIAGLARALQRAREVDPSAVAAWRDRTDDRMGNAVSLVRRLRHEGGVRRSWRTREAAVVLWELTSLRVWDDLVNEAGLLSDRYVELVTTAAVSRSRRGWPNPRRALGRHPRRVRRASRRGRR